MKNLMRISEVAKTYGIARSALIHYDNINLLKPSYRNDKEYRFYNHEDLAKLELILALKESGLTIKDIKNFLQGGLNESSIDLLTLQQDRIDEKIEKLMATKDLLSDRVALLKEFSRIKIYEGIEVEYYPDMALVVEPIGYGPLMSLESAKKRLKNKLPANSHIASKFGVCFDISNVSEDKLRMKYVNEYQNMDIEGIETIIIPASKYLKSIHYGTMDSAIITIKKILEYANDKGFILKGEAFWVPLFNYWEIKSENEFVNEVLIPYE